MRATVQSPAQGVRQGLWSRSKCTNLTPFNPWFSIIDKKMRAWKKLDNRDESKKPFILVEQPAPGFVIPCTESEIRAAINRIPAEFLKNLTAIVVIGGSQKIEKAFRKYAYGTYWNNWIFLAAYPQNWMTYKWSKGGIQPDGLIEYKQSGATVEEIKGGMQVIFDLTSLKRYYLQNVLIHEIAHHIDQTNTTFRKRENFAKWFATEYGYRLRLNTE
jgi:hypothetical protein